MSILADLLLVIHVAFVLFVVAGGAVVLYWPRAAWVHVPAVVWGVVIELTGWVCPLTPWEIQLRGGAGAVGRESDFIERMLTPLIYPNWLTRELQIALGCGVLILNGVVYAVLIARRPKPRRAFS